GIVVTARGPAFSGSAVTDGAGSFALAGVPIGTYSVTAAHDPDWVASVTEGQVVAASGSVATVSGTLLPVEASGIAGVVALEGAASNGGTSVALSGTGFTGAAVSLNAPSAADGSYSFSGLAAGSYSVSFTHAGFDAVAPVPVSVSSKSSALAASALLPLSRGS